MTDLREELAELDAQLTAIHDAWLACVPMDMGTHTEIPTAQWEVLDNAICGRYEMTPEQWAAMEATPNADNLTGLDAHIDPDLPIPPFPATLLARERERVKALEDVLRDIALHTNPNAQDGAHRFDSAHDACDFAYKQASQVLHGKDNKEKQERVKVLEADAASGVGIGNSSTKLAALVLLQRLYDNANLVNDRALFGNSDYAALEAFLYPDDPATSLYDKAVELLPMPTPDAALALVNTYQERVRELEEKNAELRDANRNLQRSWLAMLGQKITDIGTHRPEDVKENAELRAIIAHLWRCPSDPYACNDPLHITAEAITINLTPLQ